MHPLCWILGHSLGERTIDERRETRPHGRVLLVREYRSCRRCGAEVDLFTNSGLIAPAEPENGQRDDADINLSDQEAGPSNTLATDKPAPAPTERAPEAEGLPPDPIVPATPTDRHHSSGRPSSTSTERAAPELADGDTQDGVEIISSTDSEPDHRCPECGFEVIVASSPYMPGDICSNCHQGYIESIGTEDGEYPQDRLQSSGWPS